MNKVKKNLVIVGFTDEERKSIALPYIEKGNIHYVNTISEAIRYQGYLLIIDNTVGKSIVDLDKKYRKSFRKYERIWLYHEKYCFQKNKWSRIETVNRDIFLDVSFSLTEEWETYKIRKDQNTLSVSFHLDKQQKLNDLSSYLKNFQTISTKQIVQDLGMNVRSIERYMFDLNCIYDNIGYDYSKNEWYFIQ